VLIPNLVNGEVYFYEYNDLIEFMEGDTPLGAWRWDEDEEQWFFDSEVPLAVYAPAYTELPKTGASPLSFMFILLGLCLIAMGTAYRLQGKTAK